MMNRDILIEKLTLLDTASYRCRALCHNRNPYALKTDGHMNVKEPLGFRNNLRSVYDELSVEQLLKLYKFKKGDHNE